MNVATRAVAVVRMARDVPCRWCAARVQPASVDGAWIWVHADTRAFSCRGSADLWLPTYAEPMPLSTQE